LLDPRETMSMPVEMEMFTGAIRMVTGPSGITAIGILLTGRNSEVKLATVC
jgi:hypothetical protein